jgi:hemoglobin
VFFFFSIFRGLGLVSSPPPPPQQYTGRPMGDTHRHLGITQDEWASFMDDLHQSLARFQVPQPEQAELVAIVESTRDAIVVAPFAAPASGQ